MATQTEEKPTTPFDLLGGHPVLERIVRRFYDLMDTDPAYKELRDLHAPDLEPVTVALASFLAGWAGGPRDWFDNNPGKCMASVHKGIVINRQTAGQWAEAMARAIEECGPENKQLGEAMADMLSNLARSMARD